MFKNPIPVKVFSKTLIITTVAVLLLVLFCLAWTVLQVPFFPDYYIFADITECEVLETLDAENGKSTKYQDTTKDTHIDDLQYSSFFAGEYASDQYKFKIFAYEFEDAASAKAYFENITGKSSDEISQNFTMSAGIISTELVVLSDCKAYTVYCPTYAVSDVLAILENNFSIKIK